ncbi:hypothetical protein BHE74_00022593 [Ensete ventricosum]|nr:hypothetical protein GW17_00029059 [Ensete ventricosum]RWW69767.1 hypothetical protein BHE74_00022593 [Ensete ventricosum]RZR82095.1 hypothetical protein BHM03_00008451 [Ensete ventricosum]
MRECVRQNGFRGEKKRHLLRVLAGEASPGGRALIGSVPLGFREAEQRPTPFPFCFVSSTSAALRRDAPPRRQGKRHRPPSQPHRVAPLSLDQSMDRNGKTQVCWAKSVRGRCITPNKVTWSLT